MLQYIRDIQEKLITQYGYKRGENGLPQGVVDGLYPMTIDSRLDNVEIKNGRIFCCNFKPAPHLSPQQLRAIISQIGLSNQALGRALGHSSNRTVQRWLAGDTPVPWAEATILHWAAVGRPVDLYMVLHDRAHYDPETQPAPRKRREAAKGA